MGRGQPRARCEERARGGRVHGLRPQGLRAGRDGGAARELPRPRERRVRHLSRRAARPGPRHRGHPPRARLRVPRAAACATCCSRRWSGTPRGWRPTSVRAFAASACAAARGSAAGNPPTSCSWTPSRRTSARRCCAEQARGAPKPRPPRPASAGWEDRHAIIPSCCVARSAAARRGADPRGAWLSHRGTKSSARVALALPGRREELRDPALGGWTHAKDGVSRCDRLELAERCPGRREVCAGATCHLEVAPEDWRPLARLDFLQEHGLAPPCRSAARPPAARWFATHPAPSPSIATRYRSPSTSAMTTGNDRRRPLRRPRTWSVASRFGQMPAECRAACPRLSRRASGRGRPPA